MEYAASGTAVFFLLPIAQRRKELPVRLISGTSARYIITLVARESLALVAAGVIGAAAASELLARSWRTSRRLLSAANGTVRVTRVVTVTWSVME